jgi:hypothetical protein
MSKYHKENKSKGRRPVWYIVQLSKSKRDHLFQKIICSITILSQIKGLINYVGKIINEKRRADQQIADVLSSILTIRKIKKELKYKPGIPKVSTKQSVAGSPCCHLIESSSN